MRDVTDNVTGELPGVEQKRGRGRPRKAHAMTNAERQAAFRARRKAQQPVEAKSVTKRMTVTEMLSDVDAYDECRLEVEELRERVDALLFELRETTAAHNEMAEQLVSARKAIDGYKLELLKAYGKVGGKKSVTSSNGNSSDRVLLQLVLELLALACKGKRDAGVNVLLRSRAVQDVAQLGTGALKFVSAAIEGRYVPYVAKAEV